jgi:hypothetical protein
MSPASTSKDTAAKPEATKPADEAQQQSLGILEEDDEFEEFPAAGTLSPQYLVMKFLSKRFGC